MVKKFIQLIKNKVKPAMKDILHGFEYRLGCDFFEGYMTVSNKNINLCCIPISKYLSFEYNKNNMADALKKYHEKREKLLEMHRLDNPGPCKGCKNLTKRKFPKTINTTIIFGSGFKGDVCNLRCIYCSADEALNVQAKNTNVDYLTVLKNIIKTNKCFIDINFATGEFFARKDANGVLDYLYDKNVRINVTSNSTIFNEKFLKFIRQNKTGWINTSLDAGTKETYEKIKKHDFFHRVIKNLMVYSNNGALIELKYLFLPGINDNKIDIDGFLDVAKQIQVKSVSISTDNRNKKRLPKKTIVELLRLYDAAKLHFPIRIDWSSFVDEDCIYIKEKINLSEAIS